MIRILVVEDDLSVSDLVKTVLEGEGYSVETAASAELAKAIIAKQQPQLALIDIILPGQGGMDLILELHMSNPKLGIVLTSGKIDMTMSAFKSLARQFGVISILPKPFTVEELLTTVKDSLASSVPA